MHHVRMLKSIEGRDIFEMKIFNSWFDGLELLRETRESR